MTKGVVHLSGVVQELWYQKNWKVLPPISMTGNIGNTGKKTKKQMVLQFMPENNK